MRNYIILNGKSSSELKGLLIQNLPPISKPRIRNTIEEKTNWKRNINLS